MVDQNEIDRKVRWWLRDQLWDSLDHPSDARHRWERFVAEHDVTTAQALRQCATAETFLLLDALFAGLAKERRTGTKIDDNVLEDIRQGGSPSFEGNRDEVRCNLQTIIENREELFRRLLRE